MQGLLLRRGRVAVYTEAISSDKYRAYITFEALRRYTSALGFDECLLTLLTQ